MAFPHIPGLDPQDLKQQAELAKLEAPDDPKAPSRSVNALRGRERKRKSRQSDDGSYAPASVSNCDVRLPPDVLGDILDTAHRYLTERQISLLQYRRLGLSVTEAARFLDISANTAYRDQEDAFQKIRDNVLRP